MLATKHESSSYTWAIIDPYYKHSLIRVPQMHQPEAWEEERRSRVLSDAKHKVRTNATSTHAHTRTHTHALTHRTHFGPQRERSGSGVKYEPIYDTGKPDAGEKGNTTLSNANKLDVAYSALTVSLA